MLAGKSPSELREIAEKAIKMANDLEQEAPSNLLAIEAGISDNSYKTVRWGWIPSYSGTAIVTMANGTKWKCIGHKPRGCASYVSKNGYIEKIKL